MPKYTTNSATQKRFLEAKFSKVKISGNSCKKTKTSSNFSVQFGYFWKLMESSVCPISSAPENFPVENQTKISRVCSSKLALSIDWTGKFGKPMEKCHYFCVFLVSHAEKLQRKKPRCSVNVCNNEQQSVTKTIYSPFLANVLEMWIEYHDNF